ncbi:MULTISPECIES: type II toxin-antitoxin system HicA family toxin [Nitrospirillum]|uniref:type II toxin-antitoxin system HicA family toxin n=1 Tax=Nitrospirillum amazonense TaxID=28077 RepID=UPI001B3B6137|nr:type II toxin-antitoxin system HicA family toxin [Nitrospirillum amazonense]MEC4590889.1 type II toxin-antitoxin system HicA family toxin [Nitrospirillum amazonense]
MPTKPRVLKSALVRLGAEIRPGKGGHQVAVLNGRKAHIPNHGKGFEISDVLLLKILKDLGLSRADLDL